MTLRPSRATAALHVDEPVSRAEFEALLARVEAHGDSLKSLLLLFEARFGPRDRQERQLIITIARRMGAEEFTSSKALMDEELGAALLAADITNAIELGRVLSRLQGQMIDGLQIECVRESRAGKVWRVTMQG